MRSRVVWDIRWSVRKCRLEDRADVGLGAKFNTGGVRHENMEI